jgi:hypothetical protein
MPQSTDLVTDLPADFEVFGQAVATSMADLLGGTTGQVLAKASNTNMDFTWVAQDDSNAIQNAIVDAKGDLIAATANDTPARLAVGTNGQVLTADSTAATGLAWATSSATSGPAFRAYRGTSDQSFSSSTWTKIQLNAESYDTDNCFDSTTNYRFTPTKAGYYQLNSSIWQSRSSSGNAYQAIRKNGSAYSLYFFIDSFASTNFIMSGSDLIYLNGSTDYLEMFVYDTATSPKIILSGGDGSYFSGVWIRS